MTGLGIGFLDRYFFMNKMVDYLKKFAWSKKKRAASLFGTGAFTALKEPAERKYSFRNKKRVHRTLFLFRINPFEKRKRLFPVRRVIK